MFEESCKRFERSIRGTVDIDQDSRDTRDSTEDSFTGTVIEAAFVCNSYALVNVEDSAPTSP